MKEKKEKLTIKDFGKAIEDIETERFSLKARCDVCKELLAKGIAPLGVDFFYLGVQEKKHGNETITVSYHALLSFLLIKIYLREDLKRAYFVHKECVPEKYKFLIPSKEELSRFFDTGENVGTGISLLLSAQDAKESRINGKPNKERANFLFTFLFEK